MRRVLVWGGLAAMVVLGAIGYWWVLQNSDQVVQLRLDLTSRVGAWQMREPMPATTLMLGAFGAGVVSAAAFGLLWSLTASRPDALDEQRF